MPDNKIFQSLHRQFCENGLFHVTRQDTDHARHVGVLELEERILREVEYSRSTSTRSIARTAHVSKSTENFARRTIYDVYG